MERREFLTKSMVAGLGSAAGASLAQGQEWSTAKRPDENDVQYRARLARMRAAQAAARARATRAGGRHYFELRTYEIASEEQKAGFDRFAKEAFIPALNRLGIGKVGVFYPHEGLSPIHVLIPHPSVDSFATLTERLLDDAEFLVKGSEFLNAPRDNPAYTNLEISLHKAFDAMRMLETPIDVPGRIFQLRIYESPSVKTNQKKIEMFNGAEIDIFRRTGLHPVFFGETLAGTKMPNLTYMLVFRDMDERKANWQKFGGDPEWKELRSKPEYGDKVILRDQGITNLYLRPAEYSQI
jgi:hypothetical protein